MLIFTRSSTPLGTVSKKKERKFSIRVAGWVLDDPVFQETSWGRAEPNSSMIKAKSYVKPCLLLITF